MLPDSCRVSLPTRQRTRCRQPMVGRGLGSNHDVHQPDRGRGRLPRWIGSAPCPGLNVLIGERGTGKTSVIELTRFALGVNRVAPSRRSSFEQARAVLGSGRVTVTIDQDGVFVEDEDEVVVALRRAIERIGEERGRRSDIDLIVVTNAADALNVVRRKGRRVDQRVRRAPSSVVL